MLVDRFLQCSAAAIAVVPSSHQFLWREMPTAGYLLMFRSAFDVTSSSASVNFLMRHDL
jgi:hypothetical protein